MTLHCFCDPHPVGFLETGISAACSSRTERCAQGRRRLSSRLFLTPASANRTRVSFTQDALNAHGLVDTSEDEEQQPKVKPEPEPELEPGPKRQTKRNLSFKAPPAEPDAPARTPGGAVTGLEDPASLLKPDARQLEEPAPRLPRHAHKGPPTRILSLRHEGAEELEGGFVLFHREGAG